MAFSIKVNEKTHSVDVDGDISEELALSREPDRAARSQIQLVFEIADEWHELRSPSPKVVVKPPCISWRGRLTSPVSFPHANTDPQGLDPRKQDIGLARAVPAKLP